MINEVKDIYKLFHIEELWLIESSIFDERQE